MRRDLQHTTEDASYRQLRGRTTRPRLGFRHFDGTQRSLAYRHLIAVEFAPNEGLTLEFASHRVLITGANLDALFDDITAERVGEITEWRGRNIAVADAQCRVDQIIIEAV